MNPRTLYKMYQQQSTTICHRTERIIIIMSFQGSLKRVQSWSMANLYWDHNNTGRDVKTVHCANRWCVAHMRCP